MWKDARILLKSRSASWTRRLRKACCGDTLHGSTDNSSLSRSLSLHSALYSLYQCSDPPGFGCTDRGAHAHNGRTAPVQNNGDKGRYFPNYGRIGPVSLYGSDFWYEAMNVIKKVSKSEIRCKNKHFCTFFVLLGLILEAKTSNIRPRLAQGNPKMQPCQCSMNIIPSDLCLEVIFIMFRRYCPRFFLRLSLTQALDFCGLKSTTK